MDKPASNDNEILELLAQRWSPRAYSSWPVPNDELNRIMEAARWTPSAMNLQPWRFMILRKDEEADEYEKLLGTFNDFNKMWANTAPVFILCATAINTPDGNPNSYALYDLGQSVAHLSIQALSQGLYLRQIGAFDHAAVTKIFDIPSEFKAFVVLALGYKGELEQLPPHLQEMETAPRLRMPLSDFVYGPKWGLPWES